MYKVLIADDDILMREALRIMVTKENKFKVVRVVSTGEMAVKACKEENIDLILMDVWMPGIDGIEASRIILQAHPEITIYMISEYGTGGMIRSLIGDLVKEVLEKPITSGRLCKVLENYKTEHEDSFQEQLEELTDMLRNRDFKQFYERLPDIIDEIYNIAGNDSLRLIKIFTYIGQNLLDIRNFYEDSKNITELFPINEGLILEKKTSELWLFRLMDYLFQQNSMKRYPLLDNIFIYIEKHIKEEITLNKIIEECA
ncbi:MAG: response regulator, partial [Lachnospiraceae bacterium]